MDQPPPDQPPPEIPVAPPKLNPRVLRVSLLLPMVLNLGVWVVGLVGILCWIGFAKGIAARFIGPSKVLLILGCPIIHVILVFGTCFVGCLVMIMNPQVRLIPSMIPSDSSISY